MRSVRCLSSPGVCGPRSISTHITRLLVPAHRQRLGEQVAVLRRAAAPPAGQAGIPAALQAVQRVAQHRVVVVDDRIAVGRLVARQAQRVERQRVDVGGRALLFQQAAQHAGLRGGEVHRVKPTTRARPHDGTVRPREQPALRPGHDGGGRVDVPRQPELRPEDIPATPVSLRRIARCSRPYRLRLSGLLSADLPRGGPRRDQPVPAARSHRHGLSRSTTPRC